MKGYARTHPLHQKTKPENHGQTKGINNIFNKIITENFPNLEKAMPIQVQEATKTPNRHDQNGYIPQHIIIKTTNTENRERIWKAKREKTNNIQR
jgi:hypothetical protein